MKTEKRKEKKPKNKKKGGKKGRKDKRNKKEFTKQVNYDTTLLHLVKTTKLVKVSGKKMQSISSKVRYLPQK